MNAFLKILMVAFISLSLSAINADVQNNTDSVNTGGIVKLVNKPNIFNRGTHQGIGFFVGPHTLMTVFHMVKGFKGRVPRHLFITHPETKERIPVRVAQALDFGNDLTVLHISEYESPVYYELFEGSPESLSSSEAYVFNLQKESISKLEGVLSPQYPSEISFEKTLSLFTLKKEKTEGLSGSPIFSVDGKVIGILSMSRAISATSNIQILFSDAQNIKNILSKPSLDCETSKCVQQEINAGQSKEAQYRRAIYEDQKMHRVRHLKMNGASKQDLLLKHRELRHSWLHKSIEKDFAPAMLSLAIDYDVDDNTLMYKKWLTKAAQKNYGVAQMWLSRLLLAEGEEISGEEIHREEIKEGLSWAQKAMEHGYFIPLSILENLINKDVMSEQDYRYYIKDFAERGHPEAQLGQSQYLLQEAQSDVDRDKAVNLLKQAAKSKYPKALYELSLVYKDGLYGEEKNVEKARTLENKYIELGYIPKDPQVVLNLVEQGHFIPLDVVENFVKEKTISEKDYRHYLKKAVEQGHVIPLDVLDDFVKEKAISEQDYRHYIENFAEQGHLEAQRKQIYYYLSESSSNQYKVGRATRLILSYLEEHNYPSALNFLSVLYRFGFRVDRDKEKSNYFKQKAIKLGYAQDGVMSKITSRVRTAVNACERAFQNLKK